MTDNKNELSLFSTYNDIVSVKDLMKMLNVSKTTAYSLIYKKSVKAIKIGKEYKVLKQSIIDFINKGV